MKSKYASSQIALHWLVFVLVVVVYVTIEVRDYVERGLGLRALLLAVHYSCGATILALMLARLLLRLKYTEPVIVPAPPHWQVWLAKLAHMLIYSLFIILPALGLISRYCRGADWKLFGIVMPTASPGDGEIAGMLIDWHRTLAPLGYWLIGLHAAAALLHHYVIRDNTLLRMMPSKRQK